MEEATTGLSLFVQSLTTGITSNTIWAEITKAAPFIIAIFIVSVGYMIVRKVLSKGSKLKV